MEPADLFELKIFSPFVLGLVMLLVVFVSIRGIVGQGCLEGFDCQLSVVVTLAFFATSTSFLYIIITLGRPSTA